MKQYIFLVLSHYLSIRYQETRLYRNFLSYLLSIKYYLVLKYIFEICMYKMSAVFLIFLYIMKMTSLKLTA